MEEQALETEHRVDLPLSLDNQPSEIPDLKEERLDSKPKPIPAPWREFQQIKQNALLLLIDCANTYHKTLGRFWFLVYLLFAGSSVMLLATQTAPLSLKYWLAFYMIIKLIDKGIRYHRNKTFQLSAIDFLMSGFPTDKSTVFAQVCIFIVTFMGVIIIHTCKCDSVFEMYYFCGLIISLEMIGIMIALIMLIIRKYVILKMPTEKILDVIGRINTILNIRKPIMPEYMITQYDDTCPEKGCPFCLEDYTIGNELKCIPCKNNHLYHRQCVDLWLGVSLTCPICMENVKFT